MASNHESRTRRPVLVRSTSRETTVGVSDRLPTGGDLTIGLASAVFPVSRGSCTAGTPCRARAGSRPRGEWAGTVTRGSARRSVSSPRGTANRLVGRAGLVGDPLDIGIVSLLVLRYSGTVVPLVSCDRYRAVSRTSDPNSSSAVRSGLLHSDDVIGTVRERIRGSLGRRAASISFGQPRRRSGIRFGAVSPAPTTRKSLVT